jgi:ABC-type transporter Mla subunit MlaD
MKVMRTSLLGGVAVTVLALSTAACGGGGNTTTTAAGGTSPQTWANGVCSAVTTWKDSLESVKTDVTSNPSSSSIRQAGRDIDRATETLAQSLKQLGAPETAQSEAAKKNLDALATQLQSGMDKIDEALKSGSGLTQIATVSATLASMASDLRLAGGNLKQLAPNGELQQAFQQSAACKKLTQ